MATRSSAKKQFKISRVKTERLKKSVTHKAPKLWNLLPKKIQSIDELGRFKREYKQYVKEEELRRRAGGEGGGDGG